MSLGHKHPCGRQWSCATGWCRGRCATPAHGRTGRGAPSGPDRDGDLDGAARCEAEDRAHDLPLDLEWRANLATPTLAMLDALSRDDFEAGDVPRWSAVSL